MNKLNILTKAKNIYQTEGLAELLTRTLKFLQWSLLSRQVFHLGEISLKDIDGLNESDFRPKIANFHLHVVHSNREADILEAEGFEFRSHIAGAGERLDKKAIAFCTFVDKELASMMWMAPDEEARKSLRITPHEVEFCNHEAVISAAETIPKYRGRGLFTYCALRTLQTLRKDGWTLVRFAVREGNTASQLGVAKFSPRLYGKGSYMKILGCTCWIERRLKSTEPFPTTR